MKEEQIQLSNDFFFPNQHMKAKAGKKREHIDICPRHIIKVALPTVDTRFVAQKNAASDSPEARMES